MRFSESFIEKVREATNLVELISQHTELKKSGSNLVGLCPFPDHREKTPSFSVSEAKQAFHCFGCKKGGNAFTFLQYVMGLGFPEAIEYLAERARIPLEYENTTGEQFRPNQNQKDVKQQYVQMNREAAIFFYRNYRNLKDDHPAKVYLQNRGLRPEIIDQFGLGFASDDWQGLTNVLVSKNYSLQQAEKLGLVRPRDNQSGHYDLFRNRIQFPILAITGEVIGFGGRQLGDGQPKYLNSPETPLFHKGKTFYGLNETAKFIRSSDSVIVVEGYMDFLALYQADFKNVVATLGTALTADHARLIKRMTMNVTLLFDGDQAGETAAQRSLPILLQQGLFVKGILLPDQLDPDDMIQKNGRESLQKLLDQAPDLFLSLLERKLHGFRATPAEQIRILDDMVETLVACTDFRFKKLYATHLAERLQLPLDVVVKTLQQKEESSQSRARNGSEGDQNNLGTKNAGDKTANLREEEAKIAASALPSKIDTTLLPRAPKEELFLLQLALMRKEFLVRILESNVSVMFSSDAAKKVFEWLQEQCRQSLEAFDKFLALLSNQVTDPGYLTEVLRSRVLGEDEEQLKKMLEDCLEKVRLRDLKDRAKVLTQKMKSHTTRSEDLEQFMNIMKDRNPKNPSIEE